KSPGAPEDLLVATRPTGHTAGGSEMLAAAVRRADLAARGAALTEAGLTAARIDLAPIPALVLLPDTMASAALVLADGASSAVVVRRDGRVPGLRAPASAGSQPGSLGRAIPSALPG